MTISILPHCLAANQRLPSYQMLEDYFEELPSRKWEACAEAFDDYCRDDPESGEIQR